jgi:hypothetical protein
MKKVDKVLKQKALLTELVDDDTLGCEIKNIKAELGRSSTSVDDEIKNI